jgi:hypothetical protein
MLINRFRNIGMHVANIKSTGLQAGNRIKESDIGF